MINEKNSLEAHAVCSWINEIILNFFDNWQNNSPRKIKVETSSIRLFHNNIPALDFPQTKSLVKIWHNYIPETVYQRHLNSAGWSYCDQKRREDTFNTENNNVLNNRPEDHNFFPIPLSINAKHPVVDQAIYGKIFTIKYSAEQSYWTLHFNFDLFQLQLKIPRRKQKHKQWQTVCKIILLKVRWKIEKTEAAGCTNDIIWKRGCIKL